MHTSGYVYSCREPLLPMWPVTQEAYWEKLLQAKSLFQRVELQRTLFPKQSFSLKPVLLLWMLLKREKSCLKVPTVNLQKWRGQHLPLFFKNWSSLPSFFSTLVSSLCLSLCLAVCLFVSVSVSVSLFPPFLSIMVCSKYFSMSAFSLFFVPCLVFSDFHVCIYLLKCESHTHLILCPPL